MGYVAIRGGERAIHEAEAAHHALRGDDGPPIEADQIMRQLRHMTDRVMSEGGAYAPTLAALAIKQACGDPLEAAFLLRAWRSTQARLGDVPVQDTANMRVIRRVSAAFKDIPGGQVLGPCNDYAHRLMMRGLLHESPRAFEQATRGWFAGKVAGPLTFPKVLASLRAEGLLPPLTRQYQPPLDITRQPLRFPAPRNAALTSMARGETGGLLAIAYSNMRGYGDIHPTVGELRYGWLPVNVPHPVTGETVEAGEVALTEVELVSMFSRGDGGTPVFGLGYGACIGHNEVKAIAMAVLDQALQRGAKHGPSNPSEDGEFVLLHVDGVDSMGFCTHYKMPHYVTFLADMDRLRRAREPQEAAT